MSIPVHMATKLTSEQLAVRYGVTVQTVNHWRRIGKITGLRYPGTKGYHYDPSATDEQLRECGLHVPQGAQ